MSKVLLVLAVAGLGLYVLWSVITGGLGEEAAKEDAEASSSELQRAGHFARGDVVLWREETVHALGVE